MMKWLMLLFVFLVVFYICQIIIDIKLQDTLNSQQQIISDNESALIQLRKEFEVYRERVQMLEGIK